MYKLIKGDSALKLKDIESSSVDAIITDPPYLYLKHRLDREFDEDTIFSEWMRVLKDDGMIVLFGRGLTLYRWSIKLDELGFKFREEVVWVKSASSTPFTSIQRKHEMMVVFTKGDGNVNKIRIDPLTIPPEHIKWDKLFKNLNTLKNSIKDPYTLKVINHYIESGESTYDRPVNNSDNVITVNNADGYTRKNAKLSNYITTIEGYMASSVLEVSHSKNKLHPTEKPVRLMEILVELLSDEGDVILDPFMGSGSTGVASLNLGRRFIGIEIDDEYFKTAKQRLDEVQTNISVK